MGPVGYLSFTRKEWSALRSNTPLTLGESDLEALRGIYERISVQEVTDVLLPLTRLLNLHVAAARTLGRVKDTFLGRPAGSPPYIIAIAGSVAVGKSTFARILRALLAHWPDHPRVEFVTTDGFLLPNKTLIERGLMKRKGFPESYDLRRMVTFLADVKSGAPEVKAPVYSHHSYDIVPDQWQTVRSPDILIFEGLNVLQTAAQRQDRLPSVVASDFFDFSIYVDADERDIADWYVERFLLLQRTAFQDPSAHFHRYKDLPPEEARRVALGIWEEINLPNLRENILPTRPRADLVLRKNADHSVGEIWLRRA